MYSIDHCKFFNLLCSWQASDDVEVIIILMVRYYDVDMGDCYASDDVEVIIILMVRYYNVDMGDCLKCSRCCGHEGVDVVENECKDKLGESSNMICSFDSSVNRCGQATPQPTTIITHVDPKHDVPYTTQKSGHSTQANNWTTTVILVVIIVVLVFCVCLYFSKKRLMLNWCNTAVEEEDHHNSSVLEEKLTSNHKEHAGKTAKL